MLIKTHYLMETRNNNFSHGEYDTKMPISTITCI